MAARKKVSTGKARAKRNKVKVTISHGANGNGNDHGSAIATVVAEQTLDNSPQPRDPPPFGIIGIGASAGGLEACSALLHALPPKLGMAIVFVQHLTPKHESILPDLLGATTSLPVAQVTDSMALEPDHVYVIPPNTEMIVAQGQLKLAERPAKGGHFRPIDTFFTSLAEYASSRAIGVVLSGLDSDGSTGLGEIKAAGGITIVQEPRTARYAQMPRAAIARGVVDLVLAPKDIASEISRIANHALVKDAPDSAESRTPSDGQFAKIFAMLRGATGVDFSHYKQATIRRRLQRRMILHRLDSVEQYVKLMQENPGEINSLYQDVLIHVTRFFRDPESYECLAAEVFPALVKDRRSDMPIRIWVPGCATGEEAYSVAITLLEFLGDNANRLSMQIFATDVSEQAVETARGGVYLESISTDVSKERLHKYFVRIDGSYRISRSVRDHCVFARQDLTRDPPFSNLDLIICRNVLIYLDQVLQKRLMNIFHYAIRPSGFLMLGSSESIGGHSDLFAAVDKRHKLYAKKTSAARAEMNFHQRDQAMRSDTIRTKPAGDARGGFNVQNEADRILLARFSPPGVVVNDDLQIVQFRGQTGKYLEPAPGNATLNLYKMAREGLLHAIRSAMAEVRKTDAPAQRRDLRVRHNGDVGDVGIEVIPLAPSGDERHFLVLFDDKNDVKAKRPAKTPASEKGKKKKSPDRDQVQELSRMQQELAASREYLQSIIQDLEAANEELQSANEEILSSNEELQSTNEELDTAKEELQSTNEELNTVNEELHGRNDELSRVNSDLVNLLGSVQIAVVMVSSDMRIRRFTPMAEKLLNLIPSDVGRPIGDIKPNFDGPDLDKLISDAIENVSVIEHDVKGHEGNWYSLRVRPYKNLEKRIDGAVLAVFDNDAARLHGEAVLAREFADAVVTTIRHPLVILDRQLRVLRVNRAFTERFQVATTDAEGKMLFELGNKQWDSPRLRSLLQDVVDRRAQFEDLSIEHDFPHIGKRKMMLNARMIEQPGKGQDRILLAIEDVTGD